MSRKKRASKSGSSPKREKKNAKSSTGTIPNLDVSFFGSAPSTQTTGASSPAVDGFLDDVFKDMGTPLDFFSRRVPRRLDADALVVAGAGALQPEPAKPISFDDLLKNVSQKMVTQKKADASKFEYGSRNSSENIDPIMSPISSSPTQSAAGSWAAFGSPDATPADDKDAADDAVLQNELDPLVKMLLEKVPDLSFMSRKDLTIAEQGGW